MVGPGQWDGLGQRIEDRLESGEWGMGDPQDSLRSSVGQLTSLSHRPSMTARARIDLDDRHLQYQVTFVSDNGGSRPVPDCIEMERCN